MGNIKTFNEMNSSDDKTVITREDEINMIAYEIPNSNDIILGKTNDDWIVKHKSSAITLHTDEDMVNLYNLDLDNSDLERLTWSS